MAIYCIICLLLSYSAARLALCEATMPIQTRSSSLRCDYPEPGICRRELHPIGGGPGLQARVWATYAFVEYEELRITPDTSITQFKGYSENPSARNGDILVYNTEDISILGKSSISRFINRYPCGRARFVRYIIDYKATEIGFMFVERPTPDPDNAFAALAQNPLLAAIPAGLRSEVDLESLIPSPTKGCPTDACIYIIPVSINDDRRLKLAFNPVLVGRCLLLRSTSDEHSLSFRHNECATFSAAISIVYVCECTTTISK